MPWPRLSCSSFVLVYSVPWAGKLEGGSAPANSWSLRHGIKQEGHQSCHSNKSRNEHCWTLLPPSLFEPENVPGRKSKKVLLNSWESHILPNYYSISPLCSCIWLIRVYQFQLDKSVACGHQTWIPQTSWKDYQFLSQVVLPRSFLTMVQGIPWPDRPPSVSSFVCAAVWVKGFFFLFCTTSKLVFFLLLLSCSVQVLCHWKAWCVLYWQLKGGFLQGNMNSVSKPHPHVQVFLNQST